MNNLVLKLQEVMNENNSLLSVLNDDQLKLRIPNNKSNSIGSQFYCVAGARDSYGLSILMDGDFSWAPLFSYDSRYNKDELVSHLKETKDDLISDLELIEELSNNQKDLLLDLIAHEYMHQGQLIRYFYANDILFPEDVKSHWHL